MYDKDKNTRLTLRLNSEQFTFVKEGADVFGVSPSEYLRILINTAMTAVGAAKTKIEREGLCRGNEETVINDHI